MSEQTQKLPVAELKFRNLVSDLMVMTKPEVVIGTHSSSKARNLRRMFYHYTSRLAEREKNFMEKLELKVVGRSIFIQEKASWTPHEVQGETNAPQG